MQDLFIGVDVAKEWLDVHHPLRGASRIANAPAATRSFAGSCAKQGAWVVFEASGGYDRVLREALERSGAHFSRVNPRQARDFARATGAIGKTDRVDPRCRQLVEIRKQEATRLHQTADRQARADIISLIALLDRRIAKVEALMTALVKADPETQAVERRLRTAPGAGPIVAATLIAEMPELGQLDRRRIVALAGLATVARESGKRVGPRSIGGGRPVVRTILYLAALQASRRCSIFREFRQRLQRAGKPTKAALTATARKLLVTLNAMLATGTDYTATAAGSLQLPKIPARFIPDRLARVARRGRFTAGGPAGADHPRAAIDPHRRTIRDRQHPLFDGHHPCDGDRDLHPADRHWILHFMRRRREPH
jgi:transposase